MTETSAEPTIATPGKAAAERVHVTRSRAKPGGTAAAGEGTVPFRRARKPPWLKVRFTSQIWAVGTFAGWTIR